MLQTFACLSVTYLLRKHFSSNIDLFVFLRYFVILGRILSVEIARGLSNSM